MIKHTIDKEINGINFRILYITEQYNLNSIFSVRNRSFYYVLVNIDSFSVLKENREYFDLPEFRIGNLMSEYYSNQKLLIAKRIAELEMQEVSA